MTQTLGANEPCASSLNTVSEPDIDHSGAMRAGATTKTVSMASNKLTSASLLAVCYTDGVIPESSSWYDSGIRLSVSMVSGTTYGTESGRVDRLSTSILQATDMFPQVASVSIKYSGDP